MPLRTFGGSPVVVILAALLLSACAADRHAVKSGMIQKRKVRPGWHIDIGRAPREPVPSRTSVTADRTTDHVELAPMRTLSAPMASAIRVPIPGPVAIEPRTTGPFSSRDRPLSIATSPPVPQENLMPRKKWNHWAAPALLTGSTTLYLGFFTTGTIAVLIGAALTIALAAIALRRGRTNELAGKGLAIAALMVGVLAMVVTALAIAIVGFI
ncbi:MAG: hypothetical protein KDB84_08525 [Flavobacteriales bacterium]|nr:hypothetical protein [Flavobacteriales bacterium]